VVATDREIERKRKGKERGSDNDLTKYGNITYGHKVVTSEALFRKYGKQK